MLDDVISFTPKDYQAIRRHAVKFCYQQEIMQEHAFTTDILDNYIKNFYIPREQEKYFKEFVTIVFKHMADTDALIEKHARNWKLYRIAKVDLAILRVAITEIKERAKTSPVIIISDALTIAEDFSSKDSTKFVNGILDSVVKEIKAT